MARIAVDLGHGKNTFPPSKGVTVDGVGYAEHDFNSKVGVLLKGFLENAGHEVFMAQQPFSTDVSLNKRTSIYNTLNLDLIVSIHANAASASAKGLCAFYWQGSSQGKKAADLYAKYAKEYGYDLWSNGIYDSRKNHWSNFAMLRDTHAPAILTENGFMTNPEEFKLIFKSEKYVQDVAEIIAKTVADYFGTKSGIPSKVIEEKKIEISKEESKLNDAQKRAVKNCTELLKLTDANNLDKPMSKADMLVVIDRLLEVLEDRRGKYDYELVEDK